MIITLSLFRNKLKKMSTDEKISQQQESQYNINDFPTKSKLQIQRNPQKNSSTILYKSQEENFLLHVETKKVIG